MIVAAGLMVKDEADVIVQTLTHLVEQGVERLYVYDNRSTDGTRELLREWAKVPPFGVSVKIADDLEPGYYQSRKMTGLLHEAYRDGAQWFIPCDADELWWPDWEDDRTVYEVLATTPDHVGAVTAALYDHFATGRDDLAERSPFRRMVWRLPTASGLPKVAVRCDPRAVIEMGNHGAYCLEQGVRSDYMTTTGLRIDHFPYRTPEQFIRKSRNGAAAYKAAHGLPEKAGVHWKMYGRILSEHGEAGLRAHWQEHFYYEHPEETLVKDSAHTLA